MTRARLAWLPALALAGPAPVRGEAREERGAFALAFENDAFFRLVDDPLPRGWDTQLADGPGVVLTCRRSWRAAAAASMAGVELDVAPQLGGAPGDVLTCADAGAAFRAGWRLPDDFGPPPIQPARPGSGWFEAQDRVSVCVFAGLAGRGDVRAARAMASRPAVARLLHGPSPARSGPPNGSRPPLGHRLPPRGPWRGRSPSRPRRGDPAGTASAAPPARGRAARGSSRPRSRTRAGRRSLGARSSRSAG
ncbi:lipid A-modifier LpxR family protein [Albimonas pacifica]|uniref:lipid A-modifier LpxR family protein n=1 Tax=Albimonas pacifica TaxID=1114924 RepID=UPI0015A5E519